jgi:hypothetical protein
MIAVPAEVALQRAGGDQNLAVAQRAHQPRGEAGFVERRFAEPDARLTVGLLGDCRDAIVLPGAAYDPRVERPGL